MKIRATLAAISVLCLLGMVNPDAKANVINRVQDKVQVKAVLVTVSSLGVSIKNGVMNSQQNLNHSAINKPIKILAKKLDINLQVQPNDNSNLLAKINLSNSKDDKLEKADKNATMYSIAVNAANLKPKNVDEC